MFILISIPPPKTHEFGQRTNLPIEKSLIFQPINLHSDAKTREFGQRTNLPIEKSLIFQSISHAVVSAAHALSK